MSSMIRENARAIEASCNGIARRMVTLPRSIIGGFSRVMGHGIDLMGLIGRRNQHHLQPPPFPLQHPQEPLPVQEQWAFLASFEQQYGSVHPFFYACTFMDGLKLAEDDHKLMFMYLHSPEHPFTPSFCEDTLCSELVVQFLDVNFISWGALANRGEGLQMAETMRPASFPFCAVIAPAPDNNIAVLQQVEGPISPAELVEILQRTMEEQGSAFGCSRARQEAENIRADRRLREEQDTAYIAALHIDKEKERLKNFPSQVVAQKPAEAAKSKANYEKLRITPTKQQHGKGKETTITTKTDQQKDTSSRGNEVTQILIRFPNGERREQGFSSTDKVQAIYEHIDSLGLYQAISGSYRLISSFPKRVYGIEQMGMTLKDAGLHPRASLFLELL